MHTKFRLLLLLTFVAPGCHAQSPVPVNIGDPAPPLRLRAWLKGGPIHRFENGKVYILEFWATWCKPCIAAMPHLSSIANEYRDKVTVIAVDVYEMRGTSVQKIKAMVDSMGSRMDFPVAVQDSNFMAAAWMDSTGEGPGIPRTIVVDAEGRLAWMGHPTELDEALPAVVDGTWKIEEALANRNEKRRLAALADSLGFELAACSDKPDSALRLIAAILKKEPRLEYAPVIAAVTFNALLKTSPHEACVYGKQLILRQAEPAQNAYFVYGSIEDYAGKIKFPAEIYQLAAEACQSGIDHMVYPDAAKEAKLYHKMAGFYRLTDNKAGAIDAEQKANRAVSRPK